MRDADDKSDGFSRDADETGGLAALRGDRLRAHRGRAAGRWGCASMRAVWASEPAATACSRLRRWRRMSRLLTATPIRPSGAQRRHESERQDRSRRHHERRLGRASRRPEHKPARHRALGPREHPPTDETPAVGPVLSRLLSRGLARHEPLHQLRTPLAHSCSLSCMPTARPMAQSTAGCARTCRTGARCELGGWGRAPG